MKRYEVSAIAPIFAASMLVGAAGAAAHNQLSKNGHEVQPFGGTVAGGGCGNFTHTQSTDLGIVQFNSVTRFFSPVSLDATPGNLARASAYVRGLDADGGTEMHDALKRVLGRDGSRRAASEESGPRVRQVVFVTSASLSCLNSFTS